MVDVAVNVVVVMFESVLIPSDDPSHRLYHCHHLKSIRKWWERSIQCCSLRDPRIRQYSILASKLLAYGNMGPCRIIPLSLGEDAGWLFGRAT